MANLSSAGIGSGLDVENIITSLMQLERQPITQLQTQATKIESKVSTWGKIKSAMSALNDASDVLAKAQTWSTRSVTSGDASVTATVTGTGTLGSVAIRPTQLASTQSNATAGFAAKTDLVGAGTLSIELGAWTGTTAFAAKAGATAISVTLDADDTLENARDKINAAGAGVSASIVNDGTAYRLVLTSANSGASNGFRVTATTDDDGNATDANGISRLAYDPPNGASANTRNMLGADAIAFVNNLEVHSSSNTFAEALEGVSFTIGKTSATDIALNLNVDTEALKKSVDTFVSAYNALQSLIKTNTKYNPNDPTNGGSLQGDRTAIGIQTMLRNALGRTGPTTGEFSRLSNVGFNVSTDGTLSVDATKLTAALAKPDEMRKLFAGDSAEPATLGLGKLMANTLDGLLNVGGNVQTRTESLQSSLDRNEDRQERLETRMDQVEKRLRAQYTALDASMASLSGLSAYVSQQVSIWNSSSG